MNCRELNQNLVIQFFTYLFSILIHLAPNLAFTAVDSSQQKQKIKTEINRQIQELVKNQDSIFGLEVIVVSEGPSVFSKFGHVLIRFNQNKVNSFDDITIGFMADTPIDKISKWDGLVGNYDVTVMVDQLKSYWANYLINEQRFLMRYIVPTTKYERQVLISSLAQWAEDNTKAKYTFLNTNCAKLAANFLSQAGIIGDEIDPRIPIHFGSWLSRNLFSPFPGIAADSSTKTLKKVEKLLSKNIKILIANDYFWTEADVKTLLTGLTAEEWAIANFSFSSNTHFLLSLYNIQKNTGIESSVKDSWEFKARAANLQSFPIELYQLCSDNRCYSHIKDVMQNIWSSTQIHENNIQLDLGLCRKEGTCPNSGDRDLINLTNRKNKEELQRRIDQVKIILDN